MRNKIRLSFSTIAALLAAFILAASLSGCASTSDKKKDEAARSAYLTKRTQYYLAEGGLSDPSSAATAANADWEAGKALEDTDKRLGLGQYKSPDTSY